MRSSSDFFFVKQSSAAIYRLKLSHPVWQEIVTIRIGRGLIFLSLKFKVCLIAHYIRMTNLMANKLKPKNRKLANSRHTIWKPLWWLKSELKHTKMAILSHTKRQSKIENVSSGSFCSLSVKSFPY